MAALRITLIFFVLSFGFLSCKKDDSGSQTSRLKMIRNTEGDSIFYRSFKYDNDGRISAISDSNNNGNKRLFNIIYDNQGNVLKVTDGGNTCSFVLDSKGQIIKKICSMSGQSAISNTYTYDLNGRVIADSLYAYPTPSVFEIATYSYDHNNNVTEWKLLDKNSISTAFGQYSYDDHPNPMSDKILLTYLLPENDIPDGKNNVLKISFDDGTIVTYTYQYDSKGYPVKRTELINNDPLITYTDYYYE